MTPEEFFKFMMTQYFVSKGMEEQNKVRNCPQRNRVVDTNITLKPVLEPKYGELYLYRFGENNYHLVKVTDGRLNNYWNFIDFSDNCIEKIGYIAFFYELPVK